MAGKIITTAALWIFVVVVSYLAYSFSMFNVGGAILLMIAGLIMTIGTWYKDADEIGVGQIIGVIVVYVLGAFFPWFFHYLEALSDQGFTILILIAFITIAVIWHHNTNVG